MRQARRNTIIATCLLLPSETACLHAADPGVDILLLSDFFDDAALAQHDEQIAAALDELGRSARAEELVSLAYVEVFIHAVGSRRNRAAASLLRGRLGAISRLFMCTGPNIQAAPWRETFPEAEFATIAPRPNSTPPQPARTASTSPVGGEGEAYATNSVAALGRTRLVPTAQAQFRWLELDSLTPESSPLGPPRFQRLLRWRRAILRVAKAQWRLRARLDAGDLPVDLDGGALRRLCAPSLWARLAQRLDLIAEARRRGARAVVFSMHAFVPLDAWAARLAGLESVVLQDGYLPINYPRSVYGPYRGSTFVFWSEASRSWGQSAGLDGPVCRPRFPGASTDTTAAQDTPGMRVLVLLGHGGEWTSLIFRTDIDALVRDVIETARLLPAAQFRLRAHPTMLHEAHDGWNSLDRIRQLVAESKVSNVTFSAESLPADIDWATFAISEYSLTLIEFVARNPGGIATLNPTRRRNFFVEFTQRGLPHATTPVELAALIARQPLEGRQAVAPPWERGEVSIAEVLKAATSPTGVAASSAA